MKKINISQVDTIFANGSYPIEFLLYYKNKLNTAKIRSALKKLSGDFWPIFGQNDSDIICFDGYVENDCFEEEVIGREFESDLSYQEFYKQYYQVIPADLKKLFYLKVVQYKNGTVLIPKMNHLAGDGYSYFYFLSILAKLVQTKYWPLKSRLIRTLAKPHHQRTILKEFRLPDIELKPLPLDTDVIIEDEKVPKVLVREKIKEISNNLNKKVSTNDILSAMVVKKLIEIQAEKNRKEYKLNIPIDVRRYIKEYGSKFFGNGLMFNVINFQTTDVQESDINDLAIQIRQGMPDVTKESFLDFLQQIESFIEQKQTDRLRPYNPETGCLVTNLSRLPVNRLDFGKGNPDLIFPLTVGKNAASVLADKDSFILRFVY